MLVSTYSIVAMLSKETGVMVLPIVVIYHLYCREGNITHLCRDKDTCRTVLKYVAMVSVYFLLFPVDYHFHVSDHCTGLPENITQWNISNILRARQPSQLCNIIMHKVIIAIRSRLPFFGV